jgi:aminodeoxyfutalosine synthase
MSEGVAAFALRDPALRPIAEKVVAGDRLNAEEGVRLYASTDLLGIGRMADFANTRHNGDRVLFSANQHINPTNVCVLRNTCVFCSFARMPKEVGAYTRSLEEVFHEAEQARGMPTREFHIVGGLHPKLRLSYYTDLLRGLKQRHPDVHIKALTAVEIAHLARIERTSEREVLIALREAGLTSSASPPTAPCSTGTSRPRRIGSRTSPCCERCRTRLGAS